MGDLGNVAGFGRRSLFVYTATAAQTTFSGADLQTYTLSYDVTQKPNVWVEGRLASPLEFTATTGSTIVFGTAFTGGEQVVIEAFGTFSPANAILKSGDTMMGALVVENAITSKSAYPTLAFWDTDASSGQKKAHFAYSAGVLGFHRYTDADVYVDTPLQLHADGSVSMAGGVLTVNHSSGWSSLNSYGATGGSFHLGDLGAGSNLKYHRMLGNDGAISFQNLNDDFSTKNTPLTLNADGSATFGGNATFGGGATLGGTLTLSNTDPAIDWYDSNGPVNGKRYKNYVLNGIWHIERYTDAGAYVDTPFYVDAFGRVQVNSLEAASEVQAGLDGSVGYVKMLSGSASTMGYVAFHRANGVRAGYLGWEDSGSTVAFNCENSDYFEILGGGIKAGAGIYGRQGQNDNDYGAGIFNWHWTGSAIQAWVDASNVGTYSLVSDGRYKHSVETLTLNALDQINALRPVTYRWKDHGIFVDDGQERVGFIAQEVAEVIPGAVNTDEEIHTLELLPMLSTMVKAMQEMAARLAILEGAAA
jgi:Chaperone of endosialidase